MISIEDWAEIRRLHRAEGVPIKEIARRLNISRNTVRAALASDRPPKYERGPRGSVVEPFEPQIRALLAEYPKMRATVIAERIEWPYTMNPLRIRVREIRPEYAGVDPVDREALGPAFGVDEVVRATSDRWIRHVTDKFDVVVETVGHQVATLNHALDAAAFGATVFYFGVPDDDSYPISMRTMLRNNLTLKSGVTLERRRVLAAADTFAGRHPQLRPAYLTHTFGPHEAQAAFEQACRPDPTRVKIAIVA